MNFKQARYNMIEQQIRPAEVLDQKVLDVIAATPREDFVPLDYRNLAFVDMMIPLGHGQRMWTPIMEGRMLQAVALHSTDTILEIGTGCGYTAAMLAKLGRRVTTVEIIPELAQRAQQSLNRHGGRDVTVEIGDGSRDWETDAPYNAIVIGGSLPLMPDAYKRRLKIGGRLFAIVGDTPVMECILITRLGDHEWTQEALFETDVPALINAPQPQRFIF